MCKGCRGEVCRRALRKWAVAKYGSDKLRAVLEDILGNQLLGESSVRLVIPSMDLGTGEVRLYKTSHHPHLERDYQMRALDVALATSAAPSYFPTHWSSAGSALVDGGMWANNPTGVAAVAAVGMLGWSKGEVEVLSLGCTTEPLDVGLGRRRPMGLLYWGATAVKAMMAVQSSAAMGTAAMLVGHDHIERISPFVPRG